MSESLLDLPAGLAPLSFREIQEGYPQAPFRLPRDLDLPADYKPDEVCYDAADQYLRSIIPDVDFTPVSNKGTTGAVMTDGQRAYKVMRSRRRDYTSTENEAAALYVMGNEGIAPQFVAILDASAGHRYSNESTCNVGPKLAQSTTIPSVQTSGALPVLVTELRELVDISEIPSQLLVPEFQRVAAAMVKHSLLIDDGEIMYDPVRQQAVAIDWGYANHLPLESMHDTRNYPAPLLHEAALVRDAFVRFCPPYSLKPSTQDIASRIASDGTDGLGALLHEHCQK